MVELLGILQSWYRASQRRESPGGSSRRGCVTLQASNRVTDLVFVGDSTDTRKFGTGTASLPLLAELAVC